MKFFAIHLDDLESEAFTMATDQQAITWLYLHAYCCKQMNGGEIEEADKIPPKLWLRHGIEHHQILKEESPLWSWDGSTLRLSPYDIDGQIQFEKKASGGREGAKRRWEKERSKDESDGTPIGTPIGSADAHNTTPHYTTQHNPTQHNPTPPESREDDLTDEDLRKLQGLARGGVFSSEGGGCVGGWSRSGFIRETTQHGISEEDAVSAWDLFKANKGRDHNRKEIKAVGPWARRLIDGRKRKQAAR